MNQIRGSMKGKFAWHYTYISLTYKLFPAFSIIYSASFPSLSYSFGQLSRKTLHLSSKPKLCTIILASEGACIFQNRAGKIPDHHSHLSSAPMKRKTKTNATLAMLAFLEAPRARSLLTSIITYAFRSPAGKKRRTRASL